MELTAFSNANFIYKKREIRYFMPCSLKERNQLFKSYESFRDAWNRAKENGKQSWTDRSWDQVKATLNLDFSKMSIKKQKQASVTHYSILHKKTVHGKT